MKNPLGGVVGKWLRQTVRITFGSNLLPVSKVEGGFYKGGIGNFKRLVYLSHCFIVFRGGAKTPDSREVQRIVRNYNSDVLMIIATNIIVCKYLPEPM